jgi:hypothetical protein
MKKPRSGWNPRLAPVAGGVALSALLLFAACGLEEVEVPELDGPSAMSLSLRLTAAPDIIVADGFSTSLVQASLIDQNGRALAGRSVFFAITDAQGRSVDIGKIRGQNGPGTGATVATDGSGIAQIVYESPVRTDLTNNFVVRISARLVGNDANAAMYSSVAIELRSAEPRPFPNNPTGNALPLCNFVVEPFLGPYRVGQVLSFQSSSTDPDGTIIRYEWFFGDGTREDKPQVAKVYNFPGAYTVTHVVTDNNGGQGACSTLNPIVVQ